MRIIIFILLAFGLICVGVVQAQVGSSISADGTTPNVNAMLDVQSPATGDGKGMLIPRVSLAQRTTASAALAGGLLDTSGNLRGGAAQGLIVYQTDGDQGLYFNTSQTATPAWVYLGDVTGLLASNIWAAAGSTTNYLPRTGGTMSGALNMGAQIITNVAHVDFNGTSVSVGREADGTNSGAALGYTAKGANFGAAVGPSADGTNTGAALGYTAKGANFGAAVGNAAKGYLYGAAVGRSANGSDGGAAVGMSATGSIYGAAMGYQANGYWYGVAVGTDAKGTNSGVAVGTAANGYNFGAAVGRSANGSTYGTAMGRDAIGTNYGVAIGYAAAGANSNVAIGANANIGAGGTNRIAIGNGVSNDSNDTTRIRGTLHLDGGSSNIYYRPFGSGGWSVKAFTIDHPLDPANKVLRHFCLEGPQVWNVYAGNAQLKNGQAIVQLPDYYSALNLAGSEICSLTPWGRANVWVALGVDSNTFSIAGDADVKVSWTIKVLRNDPGCLEDLRRRPVEQLKSEIR